MCRAVVCLDRYQLADCVALHMVQTNLLFAQTNLSATRTSVPVDDQRAEAMPAHRSELSACLARPSAYSTIVSCTKWTFCLHGQWRISCLYLCITRPELEPTGSCTCRTFVDLARPTLFLDVPQLHCSSGQHNAQDMLAGGAPLQAIYSVLAMKHLAHVQALRVSYDASGINSTCHIEAIWRQQRGRARKLVGLTEVHCKQGCSGPLLKQNSVFEG